MHVYKSMLTLKIKLPVILPVKMYLFGNGRQITLQDMQVMAATNQQVQRAKERNITS